MTDTPLRRIARALVKSQSGVDDFDALDAEMQDSLLRDARAVLEAIREPSEAIMDAGADVIGSTLALHDGPEIWRAMIDAALSE